MATMHELECPQCGHLFVTALGRASRSAACPVCGAALVVAVAVPVVPPPPPPPPPPPAPLPPLFPARPAPARPLPPFRSPPPPIAPEPFDSFPPPWRRPSLGPWVRVRDALASARTMAQIALVLFVVASAFQLIAVRLVPRGNELRVIGCCLVVPIGFLLLLHLLYQFTCAQLPAARGGGWAAMSLVMIGLSCAGLCGAAGGRWESAGTFLIGSGLAVVASVGFWLSFLVRLGSELGDAELSGRAQWLRLGYVLYVVGVYVIWRQLNQAAVLEWVFEAGFAVLTSWLLWGYTNVLGAALRAIDASAGRGP